MKKIAFIMSLALATSVFAGAPSYSGKGGKMVNPPAPIENCFGPGLDIGVYGAGFLPRHEFGDYKNALGGGVLAEYFFCENFGIQGSYTIVDADGGTHIFNGDFVLRYPIQSACIAPYLLVGGGLTTDGETLGVFHVGGGVEYRIKGTKMGVFADGTYNWHKSSDRDLDFTLVRVGLKFRL